MASKVMNDGDRSEAQTERNSPDLRINRPLERPGINFELNFFIRHDFELETGLKFAEAGPGWPFGPPGRPLQQKRSLRNRPSILPRD